MSFGPWRSSLSVVLVAATGACATLNGPLEDVPPEAPSANIFRFLPPGKRDELLPPERVFAARDWLDRLVCPLGDQPGWKRTAREGALETYDLECPSRAGDHVALDTAAPAPPAPPSYRLLEAAAFASYRDALAAMEKKDHAGALALIDRALTISPKEPVYKRDRVAMLLALDRLPEAMIEADDLLETSPSPIVWKYRALIAQQLGMRDEVMKSVEEILKITPRTTPLYAEAVCAKGLFLLNDGDDRAEAFMEEGCSLKYTQCCDALESRHEALEKARRAQEDAQPRASDVSVESIDENDPALADEHAALEKVRRALDADDGTASAALDEALELMRKKAAQEPNQSRPEDGKADPKVEQTP